MFFSIAENNPIIGTIQPKDSKARERVLSDERDLGRLQGRTTMAGGHKSGPAGLYNSNSYGREVRNVLGRWEDHVFTLVEVGERQGVPMHRVP